MTWISVNDQLPVSSQDVLAFSSEDGCFRAWYDDDIWLTHESGNKASPSHWMYLPQSPKVPISNGGASFGMTDNLISGETRPYSVWSESVDTAKDIRNAWETRFGGPYKIVRVNDGYKVKYMGQW